MKVRNGFVTNSSSSSFVIGKIGDATITVDAVYKKIKSFYDEYYAKGRTLCSYIDQTPYFGVKYHRDPETNHIIFEFDRNMKYSEEAALESNLKQNFGISIYDMFPVYEWSHCDTYKEYEDYWLKKMFEDQSWGCHAPFTIGDFSQKTITWLHFKAKKDDTVHDCGFNSDVLLWYYPYMEEAIEGLSCNECNMHGCCDEYECEECKAVLGKHPDIIDDNACILLLGRICIYSECGYIPEGIVDRISDISEFYCNHMG